MIWLDGIESIERDEKDTVCIKSVTFLSIKRRCMRVVIWVCSAWIYVHDDDVIKYISG